MVRYKPGEAKGGMAEDMVTEEITLRKRAHPGRKKRRGRAHTKGRQLVPAAVKEIAVLLGDRPRQRDLLIEYLHLIQDRYNQISAAHLAALAEEIGIPMSEAYEVATCLLYTSPSPRD